MDTGWLPGVQAFSATCAVHKRIVRVGGCPGVVAQWQSTGSSSQMCPGFDSRASLFTFLLIKSVDSTTIPCTGKLTA